MIRLTASFECPVCHKQACDVAPSITCYGEMYMDVVCDECGARMSYEPNGDGWSLFSTHEKKPEYETPQGRFWLGVGARKWYGIK